MMRLVDACIEFPVGAAWEDVARKTHASDGLGVSCLLPRWQGSRLDGKEGAMTTSAILNNSRIGVLTAGNVMRRIGVS